MRRASWLFLFAAYAAHAAEGDDVARIEAALPAAGAPLAVQAAAFGTPSEYLIGPGDLLDVTVFEEESLNRTVRVGPDGTIGLPLLGTIQTAGRKKSDLEAEIVRRLAEHFLFNPQVSVFVKEYRSKRVAVIGAVATPGSYEMLGRRTLLEIIAEAGGLATTAGRDLFVFRRDADGSVGRSRVDLQRLMREGDAELNLVVREGDIIQVPVEKPLAVYVYGAVSQPGMVEARSSDGLTLLQAMTRAGGPAPRAAVDRITVLRGSADAKLRVRASLKKILKGKQEDLALQADDIIVVPESFF